MKIRITAGGHQFIAETNPDAPRTVAAFAKLLPYRQKIIHVRWSGEGCWIPLGDLDLGLTYENATSYPAPGEILEQQPSPGYRIRSGELVELEHVDGRHLCGYEIGMIGKDTFVISCEELDDVVVVPYYRVKSLDFI